MKFEGQEVSELVRITVLPGQMFRGVTHYAERSYDVSPSLAAHVLARGAARLAEQQD